MPKLLRSVAAVASEDELQVLTGQHNQQPRVATALNINQPLSCEQATQAAVDEFIKGPGPELQRRLEEHASQDLPNWLEVAMNHYVCAPNDCACQT